MTALTWVAARPDGSLRGAFPTYGRIRLAQDA